MGHLDSEKNFQVWVLRVECIRYPLNRLETFSSMMMIDTCGAEGSMMTRARLLSYQRALQRLPSR